MRRTRRARDSAAPRRSEGAANLPERIYRERPRALDDEEIVRKLSGRSRHERAPTRDSGPDVIPGITWFGPIYSSNLHIAPAGSVVTLTCYVVPLTMVAQPLTAASATAMRDGSD